LPKWIEEWLDDYDDSAFRQRLIDRLGLSQKFVAFSEDDPGPADQATEDQMVRERIKRKMREKYGTE
jgi:CRISPR/Cas system endoribonuclease Cas6 (RAMP superfamily)